MWGQNGSAENDTDDRSDEHRGRKGKEYTG